MAKHVKAHALEPGQPTGGPERSSPISASGAVLVTEDVMSVRESIPECKGIGFIMPNRGSKEPLMAFAVTIDSVEVLTGLDFFPGLPDSLEKLIEASKTFTIK